LTERLETDNPSTSGTQMAKQDSRAFTLWELIWTLSALGTLMAIGAPSMLAFLQASRHTADINGFVAAVQLARSEAAKRAAAIVVCKSADRRTCAGKELRYDSGWIVFENTDGARPPARSIEEPLIFAYEPVSRGSIASNRRFFEFRAFGWRSTNGTVTFCDAAGRARAVIVSYTGRPRIAAIGPGGRPLICADLP
jgi:type IV fimbrial biogenesis protein FimT